MKKIVTILSVMALVLLPSGVQASTYTERECRTDSYGNVTCYDKVTNVETGVITYTNESVTYASGVSSGVIYSGGTAQTGTVGEVKILNTGMSDSLSAVATGAVIVGGLALLAKKMRAHRS